MSQTILPSSAAAIPKTNIERAPQPAAQPALPGLWPGEEQEDEPGKEMGWDARVWKTYVRETDRWDKEMVDGRNSSLDVLLIFAALFSAISTTFIIESLGDLKPDHTQSSAETLQTMLRTQQAMLQALAAVAIGQPVSLPTQTQSVSAPFSPTGSAVAVNILWLLSLTLSVGVSLIAMLAKDWCYRFMSGRSGPPYEQGRRRQQKWNGIKRWKMQEVLVHLPGVMHLALSGLCIYLWDIHVAVAIPVTAVTIVVMCSYVAATLLPVIQQYCPYSTPVTQMLMWCIGHPVVALFDYFGIQEYSESIWGRTLKWIKENCVTGKQHDTGNDRKVPMDDTTACMIAWLIVTCDDFRSVDVALQAIAGASPSLPCFPLFTCQAQRLIWWRSADYTDGDNKVESRYCNSQADLSVALRYIRSFAALYTSDPASVSGISGVQSAQYHESLKQYAYLIAMTYNSIYDRCSELFGQQTEVLLLTAASSAMLIEKTKHPDALDEWGRSRMPDQSRSQQITMELVTHALQEHSLGIRTLSPTTARLLLYSVAYGISQRKPEECRTQGVLYGLLVRLYLVAIGTLPEVSARAALVLAVATCILHAYPGGELPSQSSSGGRSKRARQVLRTYLDDDETWSKELFALGFVGVLPYLQPSVVDALAESQDRLLYDFLYAANSFNYCGLSILPDGCSIDGHLMTSDVLTSVQEPIPQDSPELPAWSAALLSTHRLDWSDPMLYGPALGALCSTSSEQLQKLCIRMLDLQPVMNDAAELVTALGNAYIIGNIARGTQPPNPHTACTATFYFRLMITTLMLSSTPSLPNRSKALKDLQQEYCGRNSLELVPQDLQSINQRIILDHVAENTDNQSYGDLMRRTMQLIVDFCHDQSSRTLLSPAMQSDSVDWVRELDEIRRTRRPATDKARPAPNPKAGSMLGEEFLPDVE